MSSECTSNLSAKEDFCEPAPILRLPVEIITAIIYLVLGRNHLATERSNYLTLLDLTKLRSVSRYFRHVINDLLFWFHLDLFFTGRNLHDHTKYYQLCDALLDDKQFASAVGRRDLWRFSHFRYLDLACKKIPSFHENVTHVHLDFAFSEENDLTAALELLVGCNRLTALELNPAETGAFRQDLTVICKLLPSLQNLDIRGDPLFMPCGTLSELTQLRHFTFALVDHSIKSSDAINFLPLSSATSLTSLSIIGSIFTEVDINQLETFKNLSALRFLHNFVDVACDFMIRTNLRLEKFDVYVYEHLINPTKLVSMFRCEIASKFKDT